MGFDHLDLLSLSVILKNTVGGLTSIPQLVECKAATKDVQKVLVRHTTVHLFGRHIERWGMFHPSQLPSQVLSFQPRFYHFFHSGLTVPTNQEYRAAHSG
jgi:hypothetical protein